MSRIFFHGRGLKLNDVLEVLRIGFNPLTTTGCLDILDAVDTEKSAVTFISFEGIPITRKVIYAKENIQEKRPEFTLTHGGICISLMDLIRV